MTIFERIDELSARLPDDFELNPGTDCPMGHLDPKTYAIALGAELGLRIEESLDLTCTLDEILDG